MANLLRPTPQDMLEFNIIDGIIKEPAKGAHADHEKTAKSIKSVLKKTISALNKEPLDILLNQRYERFMSYGRWQEEQLIPKLPFRKRMTGKFVQGLKKLFRRKKTLPIEPEQDLLAIAEEKIRKRIFTCQNNQCGAKTPFKKHL